MNYQQRMKELRKKKKWSQEEVAEKLGIAQCVYSKYERGAMELPVRHLIKLSEIYNKSTDYILGLRN